MVKCPIVAATGSPWRKPAVAAPPVGFSLLSEVFVHPSVGAIVLLLQERPSCQQAVSVRDSDRLLVLLLSTDGDVYTWGKGARGRLGRKEEDSGIPKAVQLDESHPFTVTSVACCHGNTLLAVKRNILLISLC